MTRSRLYLSIMLLVFVWMAIPLSTALAQNDKAHITYRQKVMGSQGASMGAIGTILKNKLPFQRHIATHARDIHEMSGLITDAFKHKVTDGPTDAKPDIWQDWDKFAAAARKLQEESAKLADIALTGDMAAIGAQVKAVGKSCGGCHKPFRKPKKESYKRMMKK